MSSDYMEGAVELPRRHDLAPRSWRLPNGTIIGEAINEEAVRLLRDDPEEYFRRTRRELPELTEDTNSRRKRRRIPLRFRFW